MWHYQKRDLSGGPHGLVTWDLPGHGHSDPVPSGHLTLEVAVNALHRVVEAYADAGRGLVLVGHSLGGMLTLHYLAEHPAARSVVRGAILVSTPLMHVARSTAGRWPGASLESRALGALFEKAVESPLAERVLTGDVGREDVSALSYRVVRVGFGRNPSQTQVRFVRDVIASIPPTVRADAYRLTTAYDIRRWLPEIDVPVLAVIGSRDRLANPDESRALAARLPRGRALILDGVGHAAFLEAHERFNAAVRRFALRQLEAKARPA